MRRGGIITARRPPMSNAAFNVLNTVYFNRECQRNVRHVRVHTPSRRNLTSLSSSCALRATRSKYNAIVISAGINTRLHLVVVVVGVDVVVTRARISLRATHSLVYNPSSHADIARYSPADCRPNANIGFIPPANLP